MESAGVHSETCWLLLVNGGMRMDVAGCLGRLHASQGGVSSWKGRPFCRRPSAKPSICDSYFTMHKSGQAVIAGHDGANTPRPCKHVCGLYLGLYLPRQFATQCMVGKCRPHHVMAAIYTCKYIFQRQNMTCFFSRAVLATCASQ